jgi:hypothetical protein
VSERERERESARARESESESESESEGERARERAREGRGGVGGEGGQRRRTPTTYELYLLYGYKSTNTDAEGAGRRRGSDVRQRRMRRGMSSRGCCVNRYRSLLALLTKVLDVPVLKNLLFEIRTHHGIYRCLLAVPSNGTIAFSPSTEVRAFEIQADMASGRRSTVLTCPAGIT